MSEPKLPTREDIAKLPRWARVAFAARCARRALPLFKQHWPAAPDVHLRAVELAVSVAEHAAAGGVPIALLCRDFQNLLEAATRGKWNNTTPVPPSVFGPLDEPEPTPVVVEAAAEAEPPKKFKIVIEAYATTQTDEAYATTQTDPDETGRRLVQLYHHLDEYCRLKYDRGITLKEFEQRIKIGAMVPAGGGR